MKTRTFGIIGISLILTMFVGLVIGLLTSKHEHDRKMKQILQITPTATPQQIPSASPCPTQTPQPQAQQSSRVTATASVNRSVKANSSTAPKANLTSNKLSVTSPAEDSYNAERMRRGLTSKVYFAQGWLTVIHPDGNTEKFPCRKRVADAAILAGSRLIGDPSCDEDRERHK